MRAGAGGASNRLHVDVPEILHRQAGLGQRLAKLKQPRAGLQRCAPGRRIDRRNALIGVQRDHHIIARRDRREGMPGANAANAFSRGASLTQHRRDRRLTVRPRHPARPRRHRTRPIRPHETSLQFAKVLWLFR
jgi:hypothetical protein